MTPQDSSEPWGFFCWTDRWRSERCEQSDWPAVQAIYEQGIATRQATFETEAPAWETWDAGHLADAAARRRAGRRGRRLGGALARLAPRLLRGRRRGQRLRRRERARAGARPRAPRASCAQTPTPPASGRSRRRSSRRTSPASRCTGAAASASSAPASGSRSSTGVWRDTVLLERRSAMSWVKVEAVVIRERIETVIDAVEDAGRPRRRDRDRGGRPRPPARDHARVPRPRLRVAVPAEGAAGLRRRRREGGRRSSSAIADAARSGNESGDGIVWTTPVENVTHNRTGSALEEVEVGA